MKPATVTRGQAPLFEPGLPLPDLNRPGAFHRGASDTERDAAIAILPKTGTQRRRVLEQLARTGERGATHWEITEALGTPRQHTGFGARINELCRDGWVRDSKRRRIEPTGQRAIVWELTGEGRAELERGAIT